MEEKGVGRPSTYAAIIATIQDREYVSKTDKRLAPTPLGEVVNGLMVERFSDIVNVEFTADMEKQLDRVEEGQVYWKEVLREVLRRLPSGDAGRGAGARRRAAEGAG